ncbi:type II toxin-antitoxin system prevent-host-death family antitoxin [Mycolicibacterium novocastrense]|nr:MULTISPECIES: type II toxin-antitoxin system prevent-host-death family antitoxin [Mycolicibacterium]MCV7023637.1 type II toxin-antitoxin system prevent-host-death family antitoxin [Mycolicibacterium novocastrense]MDX1886846.1 type II toxin-antitoxin system prevent-host-death family antitoxin [Mycolicibacterium sp. 120270]
MQRIGVRELRQYATRYLERVSAGEIIEVTNQGRPVARLMPIATDPAWVELINAGEVTPAQRPRTDLLTAAPIP